MESMVGNHGFADGNKRTTVILLNLLLERSGYRLTPSSRHGSIQNEVEAMVLDVAKGRLSFDDLVVWFAERTTHIYIGIRPVDSRRAVWRCSRPDGYSATTSTRTVWLMSA